MLPSEDQGLLLALGGVFLFMLLALYLFYTSSQRNKKMMYQDYLTKLPNRMWATQYLQKLMQLEQKCAVIMLDLDDFKQVNDTIGHAAGDELLVETARRMQEAVGAAWKIARLGGDEFLGIVQLNDPRFLAQSCRNLMASFNRSFVLQGRKMHISTSIGIARAPQDAATVDLLLSYADMAMYSVKNSGKSSYRFFDSELREKLEREEFIRNLLRNAIDRDGFTLSYLPQFDTKSRQLRSFEVQVRLENDAVAPEEFLPVAEDNRLIAHIGRIVTRKVIQQLADWQLRQYGLVPMSIDFSGLQLRDKSYPEYVKKLLEEHQVAPALLEVEVREGVYLNASDATQRYMQRLTDVGVRLALNGFGTGYSAISYLDFIPFAMIKLDKTLLNKYLVNEDTKMLEGIINLAHSLGLQVSSDGVEMEEQVRMLQSIGCDSMQGGYLGKPMPAEKAAELLPGRDMQ